MKKTGLILLLVLLGTSTPIRGAQPEEATVPAVVTAPNVDITADNGELLSERLGIGDMVYIVSKPKNEKKGWVRITRSPDDTIGIGWVEAKNVQRFSEYHEVSGMPGKAVTPRKPPREKTTSSLSPAEKVKYSKIAILPFGTSDPNDPFGQTLFNEFSSAMRVNGHFLIAENVSAQGVDVESVGNLRGLLTANRLDGVFVGKVSAPVAGSRIFQLKFLGRDHESFTLEKVKRLPAVGDPQNEIRELANNCAAILTSN